MIYLYASGAFYQAIDQQLPSLKQLVKESCGHHVRRVDRFTQLALIGAHRCLANQTPANPCGLYLSSGDGPQTNTIDSLQSTFLHRQPLMPLNFVNMVSNAAAFYIAQSLALDGVNMFVSSPSFALDKALQLAWQDLADGTSQQALIGCVDECAAPLYLQRELLQLDATQPIGEGSYWFLAGLATDNALARLTANTYFSDRQQAWQWLQQQARADDCLAIGHGVDLSSWPELGGLPGKLWPYSKQLARHNSCTGHVLNTFLQDGDAPRLLHIDQSLEGHISVLLIERL